MLTPPSASSPFPPDIRRSISAEAQAEQDVPVVRRNVETAELTVDGRDLGEGVERRRRRSRDDLQAVLDLLRFGAGGEVGRRLDEARHDRGTGDEPLGRLARDDD